VRIYSIRNWIEQSCKQVRDELSWADFQSAPTSRSAATRPWSTARSASVGPPGSLITQRNTTRHPQAGPDGGERGPSRRLTAAGPVLAEALRAVRAWLSPWIALRR
jgi:hypothetical protein